MATSSHKRAQRKAAGRHGEVEKRIRGGRRLDASNPRTRTATEVERCQKIAPAVRRLRSQKNSKKVLMVPQKDLGLATRIAKEMGVKLTVTKLSKTKRRYAG